MTMFRPVLILFAVVLTAAFGQPSWHGYPPSGGGGGTAPTVVDSATYAGSTVAAGHSFSVTLPLGSDFLALHIANADGFNCDINSASLDGNAMTKLVEDDWGPGNAIFYIADSVISTLTPGNIYDIAYTISCLDRTVASAVFFADVNQTTPFGTPVGAGVSTATSTVTVASTAGKLVFFALSNDDGGTGLAPLAPTGGCTEITRVEETVNNRRWSLTATAPSASSVTCTWDNQVASSPWYMYGVAINETP